MNPIADILEKHQIMILDGALATELEKYGCDLHDELWSAKMLIERPELIQEVHKIYFEAGADCAITASYQSTLEGFQQQGYNRKEAERLVRSAVYIAAAARDEFWKKEKNRINRPKPIVAASIGPYGAYLADGSEYRGNYGKSEEELITFHRPRAAELIKAGADILALETVPCLLEAQAFVKLLEEFPGTYAWISFSAKDGEMTNQGELLRDCAAWLEDYEQVAAVGVNCTPLQHISSLIEEIKTSSSKPIIVYPNSGETYDAVSGTWMGEESSEDFSASAQGWYTQGAEIIGGCCRTGPDEIRSITGWSRKTP